MQQHNTHDYFIHIFLPIGPSKVRLQACGKYDTNQELPEQKFHKKAETNSITSAHLYIQLVYHSAPGSRRNTSPISSTNGSR